MAKDLSAKLSNLVSALDAQFTFRGKSITKEEIFSQTGLLPAIAKRADQLCSLCLGYGIGVTFEETEGATLGVKAEFDDATPDILRYLCVTDVLCDFIKSAPSKNSVPLDELIYD